MRFIRLENINVGAFLFVIKCLYALIVNFSRLYQLLHLLVYYNGSNYGFLTLKAALINEEESNKELPKMLAGKNLPMTQKIIQALI